jgi:hypothetical protein
LHWQSTVPAIPKQVVNALAKWAVAMLCTLLRRGMYRVRHDVMRCVVGALPGRVVT